MRIWCYSWIEIEDNKAAKHAHKSQIAEFEFILVPRAVILLASATDRELWQVPTEALVLIG